jgi:hypothetical protein
VGRPARAQGRRSHPRRAQVHSGAANPGGYRLFVISGNLPANKTPAIRRWAERASADLRFTPRTNASRANPIEAQFGPVHTFVPGGSDLNHAVLGRKLHDYPRWRNANTRHHDVPAAQCRERTHIRSERQQRQGRPKAKAA